MINNCSIDRYIDIRIESLREEGRVVTAENYGKAKRCLLRYCKNESLGFAAITEDFVSDFNAYLESKEVKKSTISYYNRILRSIYNQAVKDGLVKNAHPFDEAYTKVTSRLTSLKINTAKSDTGETVMVGDLSKDELIKRYLNLQARYNTLVNKLSAIVGV